MRFCWFMDDALDFIGSFKKIFLILSVVLFLPAAFLYSCAIGEYFVAVLIVIITIFTIKKLDK